jgi:uncharacterized membrane protein YeaQ/YmgE (transglycosylase-associated protein family)
MFLIIIWLIIGAAVGGGVSWLMEDRGGLSQLWAVIVGVIAAEIGGYLFIEFREYLISPGPEVIVSFLAAAVTAAVVVFAAGFVKK